MESHCAEEEGQHSTDNLQTICSYCDKGVGNQLSCLVFRCGRHIICERCLSGNKPLQECNICPPKVSNGLRVCDGCRITIDIDVAHIYPKCGRHIYCYSCFFDRGHRLPECIECGKKDLRTFEPKNSMQLLTVVNGMLHEADSKLKYRYPFLHTDLHISHIGANYSEVDLPHEVTVHGLCRTAEPDTILALGRDSPSISVVSADGRVVTHKLSVGDEIASAVCVMHNIFLCLVGYNDQQGYPSLKPLGMFATIGKVKHYQYKVHLVQLDVCSPTTNILTPHYTHDVQDQPFSLFPLCKQRVGLLCCRLYHSHPKDGTVIPKSEMKIFTLDSLIPATSPNTQQTQSDAIWGKRCIRLEGADINVLTTAAVTPGGNICITNPEGVRIYRPNSLPYLDIASVCQWYKLYSQHCPSIICLANSELVFIDIFGLVSIFTTNAEFWKDLHTAFVRKKTVSLHKSHGKKDSDLKAGALLAIRRDKPTKGGYWKNVRTSWRHDSERIVLQRNVSFCITTELNIWFIEEDIVHGGVVWKVRRYNI